MSSVVLTFRRLRERSLLLKVAGNAGWQMADKPLKMLVWLLVGVWVARYLGPEEFGSLNFAIAFAALFFPLAELGLQSVVVRDLVRYPDRRAEILGSAFALRLIGAGVALSLTVACAFVLQAADIHRTAMAAAIAAAFIPQAWDLIDFDHQARMRPAPIVTTRVISLVTFALVQVALILLHAGVFWFALAVSGEAAMSAAVFSRIGARLPGGLRLQSSTLRRMRELIRDSWPLAVSSLSVIVYMRIDQVMLGEMLGDHAVGIFSAAVRVSQAWYFVPMALAAAAAPALTAAHETSMADYRRRLLAVIRALVWSGMAAGVLLSAASKPIIEFLYGPGYRAAGTVLAIHAWAGVFASLGVGSAPWFINAGLLRLRMVNTIIGGLVNVGMNLYAIPHYGVTGAAVSTLASYAVAGFALNALSARSRPVFAMQIRAIALR